MYIATFFHFNLKHKTKLGPSLAHFRFGTLNKYKIVNENQNS